MNTIKEKIFDEKSSENTNKYYLSTTEVKKVFRIGQDTLNKLCIEGGLQGYELGNKIVYFPNEVINAIKQFKN